MATATHRCLGGAAAFLAVLAFGVPGASASAVRVTVEKTEIRSEPGPAAKVLSAAQRGDFLEVVEETGNGWLMVRLPGSKDLGFVETSAVELIERGTEETPRAAPAAAATPPAARASMPAHRRAAPRTWERVTFSLSGAMRPMGVTTSESCTFAMYEEETGQLATSYDFGKAAGLDLSLRAQALSWLGVDVTLSTGSRDGSAAIAAVVPHPLYFEADRNLQYDIDGLSVSTTATHASIVLTYRRERLRGSLLGGVSFFSVNADVLQQLNFQQTYPFATEDVSIIAAPSVRLSDSPIGPSFGAALDVALHQHAGLGVVVRYSSATAKLVRSAATGAQEDLGILSTQAIWPGTATPVELKVGGLRISIGARLYF